MQQASAVVPSVTIWSITNSSAALKSIRLLEETPEHWGMTLVAVVVVVIVNVEVVVEMLVMVDVGAVAVTEAVCVTVEMVVAVGVGKFKHWQALVISFAANFSRITSRSPRFSMWGISRLIFWPAGALVVAKTVEVTVVVTVVEVVVVCDVVVKGVTVDTVTVVGRVVALLTVTVWISRTEEQNDEAWALA